MSKQIEALKLALEALEYISSHYMSLPKIGCMALAAVEEALAQPDGCQCPACKVTPHASDCAVHNEPAYPKNACDCGAQPEQEPVAWVVQYAHDHKDIDFYEPDIEDLPVGTKLYTSPQPSKPWVGLTDEEVDYIMARNDPHCDEINFARAIEAKLREKNA